MGVDVRASRALIMLCQYLEGSLYFNVISLSVLCTVFVMHSQGMQGQIHTAWAHRCKLHPPELVLLEMFL